MGKGNHSVNHIQKIKPRVEQVCQQLGLQYTTEANAGRMYINLQGGPAHMPQNIQYGGGYQEGHAQPHGGNQNYNQNQHEGAYPAHQQQQQYGGGHQQQGQNDEMEKLAKKFLPKVLKYVEKQCCVVM